jgi:LmbE family N-acetylglucosaminyl deacetylase
MATLVCFHAHPDDESITTGGTMAAAADAGHRVILVLGTRGEQGEVADGFLDRGESLADRRVVETDASAEVLGVELVEYLGYTDSGMAGVPENDAPGAFCRADLEEAAGRLAAILRREQADVLTVYDPNGGYGHPDHVQVHRGGVRAAELARTRRVYEATQNRDQIRKMLQAAAASGDLPGDAPDVDEMGLGLPESALTTAVDVRPWIDRKRASMRAHASQIAEQSFFLAMPEERFADVFGTEWYVRRGVSTPVQRFETSLFEGL